MSAEAPRAIDNAFRVYMLPQGLFSVAVATVLFPTLSRMAAQRDADSMRVRRASEFLDQHRIDDGDAS